MPVEDGEIGDEAVLAVGALRDGVADVEGSCDDVLALPGFLQDDVGIAVHQAVDRGEIARFGRARRCLGGKFHLGESEARGDRDQTEQEKEPRAHMKFPETMELAGVVSSKPRRRFRAKHVRNRSGALHCQKSQKRRPPGGGLRSVYSGKPGLKSPCRPFRPCRRHRRASPAPALSAVRRPWLPWSPASPRPTKRPAARCGPPWPGR